MDSLEEQLGRILGDPAEMQKIAGLARSLIGGAPSGEAPPPPAGGLPDLTRLMASGGGPGREQALLAAMRPYLSQKRRQKLDRAMQLARTLRLARLAMEAGGGDGHQPL